MSRKPKPRKRSNKQLKPVRKVGTSQPADVAHTTRIWRWYDWALRVGLPGIILGGGLGLLVAALPRIGFDGHDPVDVSQPLAAVDFPVTNQGNFSVYSASYACHVHRLIMSDGSEIRDMRTAGQISPLAPGGAFSVQCGVGFHVDGVVAGGDIDIGLKYRPGLLPWTSRSCQKFVLDTSLTGHPRWLKKSGADCQKLWFGGDPTGDIK